LHAFENLNAGRLNPAEAGLDASTRRSPGTGLVAKPRILPNSRSESLDTLSLFHSARFLTSVADLAALAPPALPEIAFAGRSNSGKSTVINVLTQQKRLAFASKTPGRTQLLNFFALSEKDEHGQRVERGSLVDLPGYGYAKADADQRATWDALVGGYVRDRQSLIGIVMVMDARRPFMPGDEALLRFIDRRGCLLHFLLNKADQLGTAEKRAALQLAMKRAAAIGPRASAQLFSALKREGIAELSETMTRWLFA
jgi:GTP-binding protein